MCEQLCKQKLQFHSIQPTTTSDALQLEQHKNSLNTSLYEANTVIKIITKGIRNQRVLTVSYICMLDEQSHF